MPLADLLGASGEEWVALPDEGVPVAGASGTARVHGELLRADDATVVARFAAGHLAGAPAVTRRDLPGGGAAWYVGAVLDEPLLAAVLDDARTRAGVPAAVPGAVGLDDVEAVVRGDVVVLLNRGDDAAQVPLPGAWTDLLSGADVVDVVDLAPHDAAVLHPAAPPNQGTGDDEVH